jgi:hypothetical protein
MLQGTDQFRKRSTTWSAVQPPGSDSTYLLGTGGSGARYGYDARPQSSRPRKAALALCCQYRGANPGRCGFWCMPVSAERAGAAGRRPGVGLFTLVRRGICERNHAAVAQKIQTLVIDDLDGSAAEGTVRFGLDGTEYEIDLNEEHARELREALARYAGAARRPGGAARRPARAGRRAPAGGLNTTGVREWAKAQGIEVKDRGRVPAELVVKFQAATG